MARVSIMFPSYNHEPYVREALESIYAQTFTDFEIVVSDDASPDHTYDIIQEVCKEKAKLHRFEKNVGASVNGRYCYDHCDSEFIALLNSDDVWEKKHLEKSVEYLDQHPECGAVFSWCSLIDENSKVIDNNAAVFRQKNRTKEEWFQHFFTYGNCLAHPSMVIRKSVYEDVGFYSMSMRQIPDFEEWIRVIKKYEIYVIPETLVKHRRCNVGMTNTSSPTVTNSIRDINEHYYMLEHYFDGVSDEYFKKAFGSMFVNKDASTHEELLCERFFLLQSNVFHLKDVSPIFAFMFFNEIYHLPGVKETFDEKYNYSIADFHRFGSEVDLYGLSKTAEQQVQGGNTLRDRLRYLAYAILGKDTNVYKRVMSFFGFSRF